MYIARNALLPCVRNYIAWKSGSTLSYNIVSEENAYSVTITATGLVYICTKDLLLLLLLFLSDVRYIDQIDPCVILIYLLYILGSLFTPVDTTCNIQIPTMSETVTLNL